MAGTTHYDHVIVGGGTCGCVLASRLSEDPALRIALVEAGGSGDDPVIRDPLQWSLLQGGRFDWGYSTTPQSRTANRIHDWPRGRALGGSSCINAMAHVRGHPSDFDNWVTTGCVGWGFNDLLPYFIKSERSDFGPSPLHGDAGPVHLTSITDPHPLTLAYCAAGEEQGLTPIDEHNGKRLAGPTLNTLTIRNGQRQTVADAYLTNEVLARPNLTVITGATVHQLQIDSNARCSGVDLTSADTFIDSLRADRSVILCAGAIATPALLLRAGIGCAGELEKLDISVRVDNPHVGQHLQDHLLSGGNVYRARRPVEPSRYQHSESLTYIHSKTTKGAPDIVLACVTVPVTTDAFTALAPGSGYTIMFGITHPASSGAVTLQSTDYRDPPLIDPQYLSEEVDRAQFLTALEWARSVGGSPALADWRQCEYLPSIDDLASSAAKNRFLGNAAYTHHHPAGTCRMGRAGDAVTDPNLNVYGIHGLKIVDASVMPTLTTGPVNAALLAIAERASDLIRAEADE